jgi:hypothetical protein
MNIDSAIRHLYVPVLKKIERAKHQGGSVSQTQRQVPESPTSKTNFQPDFRFKDKTSGFQSHKATASRWRNKQKGDKHKEVDLAEIETNAFQYMILQKPLDKRIGIEEAEFAKASFFPTM